MSLPLLSLFAMIIGFTALVAYVYAPSRRSRMQGYGAIPLDEDLPPGRAHEEHKP